jgi:dTMP kinase
MLITFEGLDYSGKSTQVQLLSDRLTLQDHRVLVLREPGGTEIGEKIRKLLLDKTNTGMTEASELFLFSASRSQLIQEVVHPALNGGMVVLCDRYYDSTTAYQGYGRGIALDVIQTINRYATGGLIAAAKTNRDRMESSGIEFYERVREGYLQIAQNESRYIILNGMQPIDDLHECIWQHIVGALTTKK